jgi:RNA polymerase sigma-70 factor (ECF subfamily)
VCEALTPEDQIERQVRRFRDGDRDAAEELARRSCRLALRTAAAMLGSREEAADVAQEVAVDVLRSLGRLREPRAFDAWVHRIAVRRTLQAARRRRSIRVAEVPLGLLAETELPAAADQDHASRLAHRRTLASSIAELPPKQRLALALRYVHDLSEAQIAAALGCRAGTASSLLSRGRAALRRDPALAELAPLVRSGEGT